MKRATNTYAPFGVQFDISIHALVKRATTMANYNKQFWIISIHALVKRATICIRRISFGI